MSMQSCHAWIPTAFSPMIGMMPACASNDVNPAELRDARVEYRLHSGTIADVGLVGDDPPVPAPQRP